MRKLVAGFASSVDGYIEGPGGEYDWILIDKEIDFAEQAKRFDCYLMGKRTYEKVLAMSGGKKTRGKQTGIKNYVFSKTLKEVDKNYILVTGDVKEEVLRIKQEKGKDIALFGGASLLASLLDLELVDEISFSIIPVLLGRGKPMVDPLTKKVWLSLLNTRTYSNGTISVSYAVNYKNP